ncbi:hypothetical protein PG985_001774 [Apiospora marii]|uniref:ABM domain-containing protein n=1 Tax=Apiospora marii TaxID=335849 RepID=A0ABR1RZN5_9PEZI
MAPITEIVITPLKPGADLSVFSAPNDMLRSKPGCLAVRQARQIEDPDKLLLFIDWDDDAPHKTLQHWTAEYQACLEGADTREGPPLGVYRAPLDPPQSPSATESGKGVLETAPVVEVVRIYFPADLSTAAQQDVRDLVRKTKHVVTTHAGAIGEPAFGFALETVEDHQGEGGGRARVFVCLAGWESMEARTAFAESEAAAKGIATMKSLPGLMGTEIVHVHLKTG